MKAAHRFLRTRAGQTAFAHVSVESEAREVWSVQWLPNLAGLEAAYGAPVADGISVAARAHELTGGLPQRVVIRELTEVVVDTQLDAVRCAAAVAAWKSWAHEESEAIAEYSPEGWRIAFKPKL